MGLSLAGAKGKPEPMLQDTDHIIGRRNSSHEHSVEREEQATKDKTVFNEDYLERTGICV